MPIYEYRCRQCLRRSTFLILYPSSGPAIQCKHCASKEMDKLISRVRRVRSEESRLESLADPSNFTGLDENDPVSMAKWMKKMGKEMGEEMEGENLDQLVDEAVQEVEREKKGEPSPSPAATDYDDL